MSGKLGEGVLPGVLRDAYAGRKSGFLGFARGEESCGLHFVAGDIVCGEAGPTELKMGEVLVARGLLDRQALDRALEAQNRTAKRLGRILEEQGVLDADEVEHALALHVRVLLARVIDWKEGAYAFQEIPDAHATDRPLTTTTGEIILEAVRLVRDREAVRHAVGDLDRTVLPAADPLLRFQRVTLTPTDGFVLSRIDGACLARDVLQLVPLPEAESLRSLLGLLCVGMVEFAGAQPAAQGAGRDPVEVLREEVLAAFAARHSRTDAEVLGVPLDARPAEVRAAYFRLAKRFHPDAHHHPRLNDLRDEIQAVFFRINAACEAISRPKAPAPAPAVRAAAAPSPPSAPAAAPPPEAPPPAQPIAGDLFRKAEEHYGEGRYWEAVALLGETIPMADALLKSRARLLLARICLKYPDRLKQAEKELLAVVQEDAEQIEAYVLLGTLYRQQGLPARAAGHYRKALELDPRHRTAQSELAELTPSAEGGESVLKRLFGKR